MSLTSRRAPGPGARRRRTPVRPFAVSLAGLLLILLSAAAGATTLLTGPFVGLAAGHSVSCDATNTSDKKPIEVEIEIISNSGVVLDSVARTLAPLGTEGLIEAGPLGISARKCRFSFNGSRRRVRGTLTGYDAGSDARVLVVIDAQ